MSTATESCTHAVAHLYPQVLDNGVAQAAAGACPAAAVLGVGGRTDRVPLIAGHRWPAAQPAAGRSVVFVVVRHHRRAAAAVVRVRRL